MSEAEDRDALAGFHAALAVDDPDLLYDRAPCGYLWCLPDGTIIKVNQTFLDWTGFGRDDLSGKRTFGQLLSGGGRIYHETHFAPTLQMEGAVRGVAFDIVCLDGRRLPVLVSSVLERDSDGVPVVIRTAVFDATERRQYERELLRAKQRAEESEAVARELAHTLQRTFIPPAPPAITGLDVAAEYRPAGSGHVVGGDFYDVFELCEGHWVITIGDVCGKGPAAAAVTALARYTIRAAAVGNDRPSAVLRTLNHVLATDATDRFATAIVAYLRASGSSWTATISIAGHPRPMLLRTGSRPTPVGRPGTIVGVFDNPRLHDEDVVLGPGDSLVLYTDGVTEGRRDGEFFGETRLLQVLDRSDRTAQALTGAILTEVMTFQSDVPRDDIAVVALHHPHAPTNSPFRIGVND